MENGYFADCSRLLPLYMHTCVGFSSICVPTLGSPFLQVEKRRTTTVMMDFSEQVSSIAMQMPPGACKLVSKYVSSVLAEWLVEHFCFSFPSFIPSFLTYYLTCLLTYVLLTAHCVFTYLGAWVSEMAKDSRFSVESFMLIFGLAQV